MNDHPATISTGPVVGGLKLPQGTRNLTATRVTALLQIVIGIIMFSIGAKVVDDEIKYYWIRSPGAGVWIGVWVCVTGFVGLASFRNPPNASMIRIYWYMNIFTTVADFIAGSFFLMATVSFTTSSYSKYTSWCYRCFIPYYCVNKEKNLYAALLGISVIEWFVALVAAILRYNNGCCGGPQQGAVVQLKPTMAFAPSHGNKKDAYSDVSFYPQPPPWSMNISPATSPATSASGYFPSQSLSNSTRVPHMSYAPQAPMWSAPNMAMHSDDMLPPPYSEK